VILLAEHDEPSLAAKKKRQHVALEKATSTPKNRVWNFFGSAPGRISCEPDLSWETATGSVQFSYETASGQAYYYTRDHLGSVREMLDSSGTLVSRLGYDVYGKTTVVYGTNLPFKQYAQLYKHPASGLDFGDNRIYKSATGTWISNDPLGEKAGINLKQYVYNDPVNFVDPDGLDALAATGILEAGGEGLAAGEAGSWFLGGNFNPVVDGAIIVGGGTILIIAGVEYFVPSAPGGENAMASTVTVTVPLPDLSKASGRTQEELKKFCKGQKWICLAKGNIEGRAPAGDAGFRMALGIGNSQPAACAAATTLLDTLAPRGTYIRHPRCKCTKIN
jgi:RHS repeat-associated protein